MVMQSTESRAWYAQAVILFTIWWAANNLYAIDSELFFRRFPSSVHVFDLVFAQGIAGLSFIYLLRLRHRSSDTKASVHTLSPSAPATPDSVFRLSRRRALLSLGVGVVHTTGSLLTAASYASIGAASTLVWKLTESFSAVVFKLFILRSSIPLHSFVAVSAVLSGVVTFSSQSFHAASYMPIITSNLIFPLRNTLLKLAEDPNDSKAQRFSDMLLFGLPLSVLCMLPRLVLETFSIATIPYVLRNALLFNVYQFTSVSLLAMFDTVAHSLLNTFKRFTAIVITMVVLRQHMRLEHYVGISLAFAGFVIYAMFQQQVASSAVQSFRRAMRFLAIPVLLALIATPLLVARTSSARAERDHAAMSRRMQSPRIPRVGMQGPDVAAGVYTHVIVRPSEGWQSGREGPPFALMVRFPSTDVLHCTGKDDCNTLLRHRDNNLDRPLVLHFWHEPIHIERLQHYLEIVAQLSRHRSVSKTVVHDFCIRERVAGERDMANLLATKFVKKEVKRVVERGAPWSRKKFWVGRTGVYIGAQGDFSAEVTRAVMDEVGKDVKLGVTGASLLWETDDARLGRTLETKYRTLMTIEKNSSLAVLVDVALGISDDLPHDNKWAAVTGLVQAYPAAQLLARSTAEAMTIRRRVNVTDIGVVVGDLGLRNSSAHLVLTNQVDTALRALTAAIPTLLVASEHGGLDVARLLNLPLVSATSVVTDGGALDVLAAVRQNGFDGTAFDMKRCGIAEQLRDVNKQVGLESTPIIQIVAALCH